MFLTWQLSCMKFSPREDDRRIVVGVSRGENSNWNINWPREGWIPPPWSRVQSPRIYVMYAFIYTAIRWHAYAFMYVAYVSTYKACHLFWPLQITLPGCLHIRTLSPAKLYTRRTTKDNSWTMHIAHCTCVSELQVQTWQRPGRRRKNTVTNALTSARRIHFIFEAVRERTFGHNLTANRRFTFHLWQIDK